MIINKHNDYQFIKIYYRDNTNFTKQNKPTPKTGWLLIWRTMDFSRLKQENK
jgi:hypothetical protein